MADIEPLDRQLWFAAVRALAQRADRMGETRVESLLRHSYHLLQLTPYQFRNAVRTHVSETEFEELLEDGKFEAAARALVGAPATVTLYLPAANLFEARVCLAARLEHAAQAATPEAAVLLAWIHCVLALAGGGVRRQSENPYPAPRKERSVPHLRVIEH